MDASSNPRGLPENAFRELKPGEKYIPVIRDDEQVAEVSLRSILIGLCMTVLFSGAAAFIALKAGQGIETAIPIAIMAVGLSAALASWRKSTLLENVNILAIGATASGAVGGAVFTIPAIWVLKLDQQTSFFQIALISFLGTMLGIMLLIPFRRYFVEEMHGKLPFPEGTATTNILVAGEKGGSQARILVYSLGLGFLYDSCLYILKGWQEVFSTSLIPFFDKMTNRGKVEANMSTTAAMAGLGYIMGLRYASIILAGSLLSWWVLVPVFNWLGTFLTTPIDSTGAVVASGKMIRDMAAGEIFRSYVRFIGIGGIFSAALIGIFKMRRVIIQALTTGLGGLIGSIGQQRQAQQVRRTDRDISMPAVLVMTLLLALGIFLYYRFSVLDGLPGATRQSLILIPVVLLIAFLFVSVSAWAIAVISVTPVSGMTMTTIILTGLVMLKLGISGQIGLLGSVLIGGVVCTALSMAGTLVTEFKVGYWVGATPKKIQTWNLLGAVAASLTTGAVILLLAKSYGFTASPDHPNPLTAPQANAIAGVIQGLFSAQGGVPWKLYGIGVAISILVELLGVSSMAFALGMYLPIELNSPLFLGAVVGWMVKKSAKQDEKLANARTEKGNLVASGFIAGGGIAGIISALVILGRKNFAACDQFLQKIQLPSLLGYEAEGRLSNYLGLAMFVALCAFLYWDARRAKHED